MTTRKIIARKLDRAAANARFDAATSKQTWFLAGLLEQLGKDDRWICGNGDFVLTKTRASNFISDLLADVQKIAA